MAVKIVRQSNKIALLGAPTSAAAMSAGSEGAPAALRAAGLIDRLRSVGYEVVDLGDDPPQVFKPDTESPRARNIPAVLKSIETLKPRVEQAVKSGALPVILSGDCSIALATVFDSMGTSSGRVRPITQLMAPVANSRNSSSSRLR